MLILANLTTGALTVKIRQQGKFNRLTIPANSQVATDGDALDAVGERYIRENKLSISEGSLELPKPGPVLLPQKSTLSYEAAAQLFVTRSEFRAAAATGGNSAVTNKTNLTSYKGPLVSSSLSAQSTQEASALHQIFITLIEGRLEFWQVQPWNGVSVEDIELGVIRPNDFDTVTNQRVIVRLFAI